MPTDLNPEILLLAARQVCEGRSDSWSDEDERQNAIDDTRAAIAAYQSTIHESSETLLGEIEERWANVCLLCGYSVGAEAEEVAGGHDAECPGSVDLSDALGNALSDIGRLLNIIRSGSEGS